MKKEIIKILKLEGPMLSGELAKKIKMKYNTTNENARQIISRAKSPVQKLKTINFSNRQRYVYLEEQYNKEKYKDFDFVINIQGDEPLIDIKSINILADNYRSQKSEIITLKQEIIEESDILNPNVVKVITDFYDNAIYFSRLPIPFEREKIQNFKYYRHIGIYGYTTKFLNELSNLKDGILQRMESLEQLKFMENGYKIKVLETDSKVIGVDTKEDLEEVIKFICKNGIILE